MKLAPVTACIYFVYSGFLFNPEAKKIAPLCLLQRGEQAPVFQGSQKTSGYPLVAKKRKRVTTSPKCLSAFCVLVFTPWKFRSWI